MTANQINYAKLMEDIRSHQASEATARRQAAASEAQAYASQITAQANAQRAEIEGRVAEANILASAAHIEYEKAMAQLNQLKEEHSYAISTAQLQLEENRQAETARHNLASESNDLVIANARNETSLAVAEMQTSSSEKIAKRANITTTINTLLTNGNRTTNTIINKIPDYVKLFN